MTNVAIYARVGPNEEHTLTRQFEAGRTYAAGKDYTIVAELNDVKPGDSLDRPGLNALREVIKSQDVKIVLVTGLDRLADQSSNQRSIEEELRGLGVTIEQVPMRSEQPA